MSNIQLSKYRPMSDQEKRQHKKIIRFSIFGGILALIAFALTGIPYYSTIEEVEPFKGDLWDPVGILDFIRCFLCVGLILSVSLIAHFGGELRVESYMMKHIREGKVAPVYYQGRAPDPKPETSYKDYHDNTELLAGAGYIACVVLVLRYIYLIIVSIIQLF